MGGVINMADINTGYPVRHTAFDVLREANTQRQKEWQAGNEISLSYRGNEFAGEAGELCNKIKKLDRERMGIKGSRTTKEETAAEMGDVVICLDLIAAELGIDLWQAVMDAFNNKSREHGFKTLIEV